MELEELIAREKVRDTVARYAWSGDRFRLAELAGCFTEDGVLEVKGGGAARGRAAIEEMLGGNGRAGGRPAGDGFFLRHFVTNLTFDSVTAERVETSAYFMVLTDRGPDHWGRYRDVYVPVADRWLLRHRLASVDAAREEGWFAGRAE
uniref:Nuclear transport factor 2 family protein n=1 Tax=Streptomyces sp. NBC_00148 TaxID=2903626 RepID=A0AAU1M2S8_9ACTN